MEFTHIRDIDGRLSPSSTTCQTRPELLQPQVPLCSTFQEAIRKTSNDNIFDYEKVLRDTPPGTPGGLLNKNQSLFNYLDTEKNDDVEDIIMTIEASIGEKVNNEIPVPLKEKKSEKQISFSDQITEAGDGDDIADANANKTFQKAGNDVVDKTYMEAKRFKSFLSSGIKNVPSPRDGTNYIKMGELRTFRVYFFSKEVSLFVPVNISLKVLDVIHQCLDAYRSNKTMNQSLIKYPDQPNAYEIKMGGNPVALDKKVEFKSLQLGKGLGELMITEIPNFDNVTNDTEEKSLVVCVNLPDTGKTKVMFEAKFDNTIKDVYLVLASKKISGYTPQFYNIRVFQNDSENKSLDSKPLPYLELQMPLKNLKKHVKDETLNLELVKKRFADEPTEQIIQMDFIKEYTPSPKESMMEEQIILYNDISAHQYEEFELIKINNSGRRQIRILGIDGFKIYNYSKKYKQEQQQGSECNKISDMITSVFYSKFGTMHPEWLIGNIHSIEFVEPNGIILEMKIEGNQLKRIVYEAPDRKMAKQIVAKISYHKGLEKNC